MNRPINNPLVFALIFVGALIVIPALVWFFYIRNPNAPQIRTSATYMYEVISSCPVNVTYVIKGTAVQQESGVQSGWTYKFEGSPYELTSGNAQLTCVKGTVTMRIHKNGQVVKEATSSGDYVIAQVADQ